MFQFYDLVSLRLFQELKITQLASYKYKRLLIFFSQEHFLVTRAGSEDVRSILKALRVQWCCKTSFQPVKVGGCSIPLLLHLLVGIMLRCVLRLPYSPNGVFWNHLSNYEHSHSCLILVSVFASGGGRGPNTSHKLNQIT